MAAGALARLTGPAHQRALPVRRPGGPAPAGAAEAPYPSRPIRILVGFPPADGYTLLLGADSVLGPDKAMYATVRHDENSFTPIGKVASTYFAIAANRESGIRRFPGRTCRRSPKMGWTDSH